MKKERTIDSCARVNTAFPVATAPCRNEAVAEIGKVISMPARLIIIVIIY